MPLGKWRSFGQCVGAQKRMGHSDISSRKICGRIQADIEGGSSSSLYAKSGADGMSFPPKKEGPQDGDGADGGEKVSIPVNKLKDVIQAIADGDNDKALAMLRDFVNIEEEGPPQSQQKQAPPFAR